MKKKQRLQDALLRRWLFNWYPDVCGCLSAGTAMSYDSGQDGTNYVKINKRGKNPSGDIEFGTHFA